MKQFMHFFSQTFGVLEIGSPGGPLPTQAPNWQPLVDIYECREGLHILVELPGIDRDQLNVRVDNGVLKITGYRAKAAPSSAQHVHQMEIPYGPFARYVRLPHSSNVDEIDAQYEDGYLTIDIPRNSKP